MAERPSLRLPAPPAKRQRAVSLDEEGTAKTADTQVADPGAAHSAAACGCSPLDAPVAAELDLPVALPNDAVVALLLLKSRFPLEAKVIPFATRSQLYTLLSDRTEADRQVEELRRANRIRLIQLPAGGGRGGEEHALLLTEDYLAALRRCRAVLLQQHRQQQLQQQPGDGGMGSGNKAGSLGAVAAGAAAGRAAADQPPGIEAFGWFAMRVLPACTETMITHSELLALLGRSSSSKPATASTAAAPGASLDTATASAAPQRVTDAHVSLLLSHGFLVRHTAAADGYLFGMPQAGMAVRSVAAGRQEILSLLHRRRQPELLEAELAKRRLQRSVLGVRWHVADLVGSGALLRLPTPVGPLLRVAKRGG